MNINNKALFENTPVNKAVLSLILPTVISQLITVIYNVADTFFIGQLGDPAQVAAVSLCLPLFIFLTGMANLLGIGGSSLIARSLGVGKPQKARNVAAFSIWAAAGAAAAYGLVLLILGDKILPAIGADEETYMYCSDYVFWTITIGAAPTVMNQVFAHLVRSEGCSREASFGVAIGGVLNIGLDPVFIFFLGMETTGAAVATMISNIIAMGYFIILINRRRSFSVISLDIRNFTLKQRIPADVLLVGLPSCMMNLMGVLSNITINVLMSSYGSAAVAAVGVAKKVDNVSFAVATGISQGVLPLIAYNYASGDNRRMSATIRTTFVICLGVLTALSVLLFTCAAPIVRAFIDDPLTVEHGQFFQKVICLTGPCIAVTLTTIAVFQSMGHKVQPLILSVLRKGGLDIPLMFIMNRLAGLDGIIWATPMADLTAMIVAMIFMKAFRKEIKMKITDADEKKISASDEKIQEASDEEVSFISAQLMEKNKEAYEELAK